MERVDLAEEWNGREGSAIHGTLQTADSCSDSFALFKAQMDRTSSGGLGLNPTLNGMLCGLPHLHPGHLWNHTKE